MKKITMLFILFFYQGLYAQSIVQIEYFIDTTPGYGNGTQVSITIPDSSLEFSFSVGLAEVSDGFHILYIRAKDDSGRWSPTYPKPFFKGTASREPPPNIIKMEYFIDTDPGYGKGADISLSTTSNITKLFSVDLTSVDNGFHILYVRSQDANSSWSLTYARPFLKEATSSLDASPDIVSIEWFFSSDTIDSQVFTYTDFPPSDRVDTDFPVDLSHLNPDKTYNIHAYAKDANGGRSLEFVHEFDIISNTAPTTTNSIIDLTVSEDFNSVIVADLDTVFDDVDVPFGDSLVYSVSVSNDLVTADVIGSLLEINSVSDSNGVSTIIVTARDVSAASVSDTFMVTVIPGNDPPAVFDLISPAVGGTVDNLLISFVWQKSLDVDAGDEIQYIFNLFGAGLDTTISGLNDTVLVFGGNNYLQFETLYTWHIKATDGTDTTASATKNEFQTPQSPVLDVEEVNPIPEEFSLGQNYPNPFNPTTTIRFDSPKASKVSLIIYDILGREVVRLVDEEKPGGYHQVVWNGKDRQGRAVSNGIYIYQIVAEVVGGKERFLKVKKLLLLK